MTAANSHHCEFCLSIHDHGPPIPCTLNVHHVTEVENHSFVARLSIRRDPNRSAGPAASSSPHTSNNKCHGRTSTRRHRARSSFAGSPKPTSKLSTVLIPEARACLSPVSSNCSSRAKCRFQRFSGWLGKWAALIRLDRVSG